MSINRDLKRILGERIRNCRKENNLTQTELGKIIGTEKTTIANYESGYSRPSTINLYKLAVALNVSISYLNGQTLHKTPKIYLEEELSKLNLTGAEFDTLIQDILNNNIGFNLGIMKAIDITNREDKIKKIVSELDWEYTYPLDEDSTNEDYVMSEKLRKSYYDLFLSLDREKIVDKFNSSIKNDFRFASHGGVDTEGLNEEDIEELKQFVEFIKSKKDKE